MSKYCSLCGAMNFDESVTCYDCGTSLLEETDLQNTTSTITDTTSVAQLSKKIGTYPVNPEVHAPSVQETHTQSQQSMYHQPVQETHTQSQQGMYHQPVQETHTQSQQGMYHQPIQEIHTQADYGMYRQPETDTSSTVTVKKGRNHVVSVVLSVLVIVILIVGKIGKISRAIDEIKSLANGAATQQEKTLEELYNENPELRDKMAREMNKVRSQSTDEFSNITFKLKDNDIIFTYYVTASYSNEENKAALAQMDWGNTISSIKSQLNDSHKVNTVTFTFISPRNEVLYTITQ